MNLLNNRKILLRFILIGLVITTYDVMLHSLLSVAHIAFEGFELALEELIEHVFHTDRHQSQLIVFYLLWLIAIYALYRLWRVLPGMFRRLKAKLIHESMHYKSAMIRHWKEQPSLQKMKWVTSFSVTFSCMVYFALS